MIRRKRRRTFVRNTSYLVSVRSMVNVEVRSAWPQPGSGDNAAKQADVAAIAEPPPRPYEPDSRISHRRCPPVVSIDGLLAEYLGGDLSIGRSVLRPIEGS